jgi:hypothetical protein
MTMAPAVATFRENAAGIRTRAGSARQARGWTEHGEDNGPRASEVMRNYIDFGVSGGFITPIHGPGG